MSITLPQSPSHQFYYFICLFIVRALLYSSGWSEAHCGDQASLEFLTIFLPLPPKFWDFRHVTAHQAPLAYFNTHKYLHHS